MQLTLLERPTPLTARDFKVRLEEKLTELKGELNASATLEGFSQRGWAQIEVSGEDTEIVTELISNTLSLAHAGLREEDLPQVWDAQIVGVDAKGLKFDAGLESQNETSLIPTSSLRAQLADGKPLALQRLVESYCLYPGERISVRITRRIENEVEGWLSDFQMDLLSDRITSGLDRIEVFDCYKEDVESAIHKAHLSRDIINLEHENLTLQSVVCKLGTDAVGLIPKLGRVLRKQKLEPFLPARIVNRCRPW